jgi:hypothetical protein
MNNLPKIKETEDTRKKSFNDSQGSPDKRQKYQT